MTYGAMADDTLAYLGGVVGGPAHLVGWSDGAVVGLLVAQRRPDLVDRLVLIGQWYNSSGKVGGGLADQLSAGGDQVMGFLRAEYDQVTLEHGAAVAAALPRGRLAVLPGTHLLPAENPEVVNALLVWFLAGATTAVDWSAPGSGR